jgi:hypothetical protein
MPHSEVDRRTACIRKETGVLARTYNAIDADGHILELLDLWDQRRTQKPRQTRSLAGLKLIAPVSLPPKAFEPAVDVTVVHGVIAFDDAGLQDGEPPHHQVVDVRHCLLMGRKAQRVAAPLARCIGDDLGF